MVFIKGTNIDWTIFEFFIIGSVRGKFARTLRKNKACREKQIRQQILMQFGNLLLSIAHIGLISYYYAFISLYIGNIFLF